MPKLEELISNPDYAISLLENTLWMLSSAEQDAFRRCAVVRTVDEDLYRDVLTENIPEDERLPYEKILNSSFVERLAGPRARCQLSSDLRSELLRQWWGEKIPGSRPIPEDLKELSSRLAGAFEARDMPIEQLYHLMLADEEKADRICQSILKTAATSFNLTRYYDLYRVYDERLNELGDPGLSLLTSDQERQRRILRRDYDTRALFRSAWYATSYYVQRSNLKHLYSNLTSPDGNWIVQLYASGGMGKTTKLRHLTARECLPANVPVASIDFDYVESMGMVGVTANQPWLLLIPIAKQLNVQFADPQFDDFLMSYGSYDVLVDPGVDTGWIDRTQLLTYFSSLIKRRAQSIILIFDTMENLRHSRLFLDDVYRLVRDLHEEANNVRVIFSGRFDLREPLPHHPASNIAAVEGLSEDLETIEIEPFTPDEAEDYLISRGIKEEDDRLPVMIEKGGGNPFKLASLAEFVLNNDDITREELSQIKRSDVEYLIRRIIGRIKDETAVRWVLRYGVVRRSITKEFIEQVMLKFILDYWSDDDRSLDDPARDDITIRRDGEPVFPVPKQQVFDVDHVWSKLKEFAAPYSWLELTVNQDVEELRFQPDVVVPMRYLLLNPVDPEEEEEPGARQEQQERSIYRQLHRAAFEWYGRQLQTAEAVAEQVYHKFLSLDEDAVDFWFDKLNEYDEDDMTVSAMCRRLLEELVDASEFGESEVVKIPTVVKARAELELAWRTISQDGRQLRDSKLPDLTWLAHFDPASPPAELPGDRWATVRAAKLLLERRPEDALQLLLAEISDPLKYALKQVDRRLLLVLVDLLLALPPSHGERHRLLGETYIRQDFDRILADIWERSNIGPRRDSLWLMLTAKWARLLEENSDFDLAIRLLNEFTIQKVSGASELGQCAYNLVRLYSKVGQENVARSVVDEYEHFKAPESLEGRQQRQWHDIKDFWQRNLMQESYLALSQTDLGPQFTVELSELVQQFEETEQQSIRTLTEALDARVAVEESNLSMAFSIWDIVQHDTRLRQTTYEHVEVSLDIARTLFEQEHNVNDALYELESLEKELGALPGRAVALKAHLLRHGGREAEAKDLLKSFYENHFENAPLDDQIPVLIASIALDLEEIPAFRKLEEATLALTPATRRLVALEEFAKCQAIADENEAGRLAQSLLPAIPTEDESQDRPTALMRYADILRVLGRTEEAEEALLEACAFTDKTNTMRPYLWRDLLRTFDRCGWQSVPVEKSQQWLSQLRETSAWSTNNAYRTLMLIEQATRLLDYAHAYEEADALLEEAKPDKDLWRAHQYHAVAARVAAASGRKDADVLLELAIKDLEHLGNRLFIAQLKATPEILSLSEEEAVLAVDETHEAKGIDESLFVLMRLSPAYSRHKYPMRFDLELEGEVSSRSIFGESSNDKMSGELSHEFVEDFATDWDRISKNLAEELFEHPDLDGRLPPDETTTLNYGLEVDPANSWMPWEFSLLEESFFFKTARQKHTFFRPLLPRLVTKKTNSRTRPRVLVARDRKEMDRLGGSRSGALDPISFYRKAGADVEEVDSLNMKSMLVTLEKVQPDILHMMATLGEVDGRAVIYDEYDVEIFPQTVIRVLRQANIPLLILEASSASSLHDRIRKMCLRNQFAAEVAESGVVRHILAVGVAEHEENYVLLRRLIEGLCMQGFTPAQVAMKLRRLGAMVRNPFWIAADDPEQEDLTYLGQSESSVFESLGPVESSVADLLAFSGIALWTADIDESFSRPEE